MGKIFYVFLHFFSLKVIVFCIRTFLCRTDSRIVWNLEPLYRDLYPRSPVSVRKGRPEGSWKTWILNFLRIDNSNTCQGSNVKQAIHSTLFFANCISNQSLSSVLKLQYTQTQYSDVPPCWILDRSEIMGSIMGESGVDVKNKKFSRVKISFAPLQPSPCLSRMNLHI